MDSLPIRCNTCGDTKPQDAEHFHKDKKSPNGLSRRCKECAKAKTRQWKKENPERTQATNKAVREAHKAKHLTELPLGSSEPKRCPKCGETKSLTPQNFCRDFGRASGFHPVCKTCREQHLAQNEDHYRSWRKGYNQQPEVKEKARLAAAEVARANPEVNRARAGAWYRNNRHKRRAYIARNRSRIAAHDRAMRAQRRAQKRAAGGKHTYRDVLKQLEAQLQRCWWCGHELTEGYHVDHRIALAKGGTNGPENIVIACQTCNVTKGARMPWEFSGRLL